MYDIFYVSKYKILPRRWKFFKQQYPTAQKIEQVTCFDDIKSKAFTKMFWIVWDDLNLINDFCLSNYHASKWDESYVHCFLNKETDYARGLTLFPKNYRVSDREFENRYYINKKEIEIIATQNVKKQYDCYILESYDQYLDIVDNSRTEMFWGQWPDIEITDSSVFELWYDPNNGKFDNDRKINHIFLHQTNNTTSYVNGLILFSVEQPISKKEFDRRYLVSKKEHNKLVSKHKLYDVFFISYDELNADENYQRLLSICPRTKRIHGVKGIHQAHIEAAKQSTTDMFWVVDGDAYIIDEFDFNLVYFSFSYEIDCVHVWKSRNPINELEYGNGGVKLLPQKLTLELDVCSLDMTTSISKKFKSMTQVSNETRFNTSEFNTWKSAFRECVKLASKKIFGHCDNETEERLNVWCTAGHNKKFGEFSIRGAIEGKDYGIKHISNPSALNLINNFEWLQNRFIEGKDL